MPRLSPGDRAPNFSLPREDGTLTSLSDFAGKRLVLYFYPRDATPGCTKEACQFSENLRGFTRLGAEVLGVSPDSPESHLRFREDQKLGFHLLSDPDKKVMERYGAYGEKMLYGKKVTGVIRSTFVISPAGRIEHAFYAVRANGHASKVLETLAKPSHEPTTRQRPH